jgi:hypothetical protein
MILSQNRVEQNRRHRYESTGMSPRS